MSKVFSLEHYDRALVSLAQQNGSAQDVLTVKRVLSKSLSFLTQHSVVVSQSNVALEKFDVVPTLNGAYGSGDQELDIAAVEQLVTDCGVPAAARHSTALEVCRVISGGINAAEHFSPERAGNAPAGVEMMSLYDMTGMHAYGSVVKEAAAATEAFGKDIDTIAADARLNISLTLLRPFTNLLDRVLPRIAAEQNTINIRVPAPQVYDLEKAANASSAVRNRGDHIQPMVKLYRQPQGVSTAPKLVVPNTANDGGGVYLLGGKPRVNVSMNLLDLTMDGNRPGYAHGDFTDTLSEGGRVKSVTFTVTDANGGTPISETFELPVVHLQTAKFTATTNNDNAADRVATFRAVYSLNKDSKKADGSATAIFADYAAPAAVTVEVNFTAKVNLMTFDLFGSGAITAKLTTSDGSAAAGALISDQANLSYALVKFDPELYFSEENARKTTTAVRLIYSQKGYEIPVAKSFITDYSIQQSVPDDVMTTINNTMSLGNSARGMDVIESVLRDVATRLDLERQHPEIQFADTAAASFAAGTLVLPAVIQDTLDFSDADNPVAVLRETERLSELHGRARARHLTVAANLYQKSLYRQQLEANELPVFKIVTSTQLCSTIYGISDYHNELNDRSDDVAPNTSYSMELPDGTRLDIVATDWDNYANKVTMFPVRQQDPTHVTSFAAIHDRGTFVGQYTPTANNAVWKRVITNSREFPIVTNPMGALMTIAGIDAQLGAVAL